MTREAVCGWPPRLAVVGLLITGVVLGPYVLRIFAERTPIADFFAELGGLLLILHQS